MGVVFMDASSHFTSDADVIQRLGSPGTRVPKAATDCHPSGALPRSGPETTAPWNPSSGNCLEALHEYRRPNAAATRQRVSGTTLAIRSPSAFKRTGRFMKIDSSIASLLHTQRIAPRSSASNAASSSATAASSSGASSTDTVTISSAAKAAAQASEGYNAAFRNKIIQAAEADPQFAARTAYEYAHDTWSMTGPLVNINTTPMTYSFTGEVVTPENLAAFKSEAASARTAKIAIYDSEKAKGTSDVEILKKLYATTNSQPDDYLTKIAWVRDASSSTSGTQAADFTSMTRKGLADWINARIKSGEMSLDESSTFVSMTLKVPVDGSHVGLDDQEVVNFVQRAKDGMAWAQQHHDSDLLERLQAALGTMLKYQP